MIRFSIGVPPNLSFAAYGRLAALIERYAFSLLIVDDVPNFVSCWGILFFLAQQTRRIQLGPSVTHPYLRHPLLTAANVAALDELSGGRAFLGLGRGDSFHHLALHTPMPRPVRALREAVALIRQALAGSEEGFRGEVFQVEPAFGLAFKPRRAQVPIYLGTTGPVGFRLVGEIADGAHSPALLVPAAVTMARENIEAGARASGRDAALLDVAASCWASLGGDRRLALRRAKEELLRHLPELAGLSQAAAYAAAPLGSMAAQARSAAATDLRAPAAAAEASAGSRHAAGARPAGMRLEEIEAAMTQAARGNHEAAITCMSDELAAEFSICGTEKEAVRRIGEVADAGVRHLILKAPLGPDPAEAIQLIGERIIPYFQGAAG